MTEIIKKFQRNFILYIFLSLMGIIMVFPFLWMISTSLKSHHEIYTLSLIPNAPSLENYIRMFEVGRFGRWFFNSLVVGMGVTISAVFFDSLVGYTLCKFDFKGKYIIFILILATIMIPMEMLVIPWYIMFTGVGLNNSYFGIMLPGIMTGFGVFLMKQFFTNVPDDLIDAARVDGLDEFRIWWKIAMPLVKPAVAALAILTFLHNWNTFLWPLIVITDSRLFTIPVGLSYFSGEYQTAWELVMAGASFATVPVIVVFLIFQKQIIEGIQLTGLK